MPRDDDCGESGVEFLVGPPEPGPDEDLPQPDASRRPRIRLALAAVAGLALVVALIVRGVTTQRTSPAAAATSDAPSPTPVVIRDEAARGPAACPRAGDGQSICRTRHTVGAPVLAAVRDGFPGARIDAVLDEQLRDVGFGPGGLWYRSITAYRAATRIVVTVRVPRLSDSALRSSRPDGARTTISLQKLTRTFVVTVSVTATSKQLPSFNTLAALAGDRRLAE